MSGPGVLTGITGFNIHDNTIRNLPRAAINLEGATGGTGMIINNTITNLSGNDNAINIFTTAAGVNFTLTGNTVSNVLDSGIRVLFGSGTVVVSNNTVTNVGTLVGGGGRGIDVDGAGTTTISGNTVNNTGAAIDRSGIQVNATGGLLNASVTGNTAQNTTEGGIEAQTTAVGSTLCLRMTGNTTGNSFVLDNTNTGNLSANFQIEGPASTDFETANTGTFTYLANIGAVTFVPVGTCGFAP
jgi:parallel beta-helix repeat protein